MWRLTGEGIDVKFVLDRAARLPCFRSRALSSCRCPPRRRCQAVLSQQSPVAVSAARRERRPRRWAAHAAVQLWPSQIGHHSTVLRL